MNIGFYGHSTCSFRSEESLIDIIAKKTKSNIVNIGVRQGSEERVLWELKKTKNLDLAIIFHCPSNFFFLPGCDRDFKLDSKFTNKAEYIWNVMDLKEMNDRNHFHQEHHRRFIAKFKTITKFVSAMNTFRSYFYDPDLIMNRYYGALIQIDQYITAKKINTIHVLSTDLQIPSWFKFSSGVIDNDIAAMAEPHKLATSDWFVNGLTEEGNILVADKLYELILANDFLK